MHIKSQKLKAQSCWSLKKHYFASFSINMHVFLGLVFHFYKVMHRASLARCAGCIART
jgi:hypothetical protein